MEIYRNYRDSEIKIGRAETPMQESTRLHVAKADPEYMIGKS